MGSWGSREVMHGSNGGFGPQGLFRMDHNQSVQKKISTGKNGIESKKFINIRKLRRRLKHTW